MHLKGARRSTRMDTDIVCEYVYKSPRTDFTQYLARFRYCSPVIGRKNGTAVCWVEIPVSARYAKALQKRICKEDRIVGEGVVRPSSDIAKVVLALIKKR